MKIRIKGNSIRYRLTKTEVLRFGQLGFLEEKTEFIDGARFQYRLEKKNSIDKPEAFYTGNSICISIPENIAADWVSTDIVSIDHAVHLGEGKELLLLIEKDFACLDHSLEDQSDNYPNPNKVC